MRTTIHGHAVKTQPADGLRDHYRVTCDGSFVGLVSCDQNGWHTLPRTLLGVQSPPICHAPTLQLALTTIVTEVVG